MKERLRLGLVVGWVLVVLLVAAVLVAFVLGRASESAAWPGSVSEHWPGLRTAPAKPATNRAANAHPRTWTTQPAMVNHLPADVSVAMHCLLASVSINGRPRSRPTPTHWTTPQVLKQCRYLKAPNL
jgi:hypothetical protein